MHTKSSLILCDIMDSSPQAPLSMGFSRQEYWSGLPCPPPGDLPDPGTEPASLFFFVFFCFLFFVFFILFYFKFYFIFKLNITVLDLPNIKMNLPQVYMCSPLCLLHWQVGSLPLVPPGKHSLEAQQPSNMKPHLV